MAARSSRTTAAVKNTRNSTGTRSSPSSTMHDQGDGERGVGRDRNAPADAQRTERNHRPRTIRPVASARLRRPSRRRSPTTKAIGSARYGPRAFAWWLRNVVLRHYRPMNWSMAIINASFAYATPRGRMRFKLFARFEMSQRFAGNGLITRADRLFQIPMNGEI